MVEKLTMTPPRTMAVIAIQDKGPNNEVVVDTNQTKAHTPSQEAGKMVGSLA
jgi:hypothetical protein